MLTNNSLENSFSSSTNIILSLSSLILGCSIYLLAKNKDSPVYHQSVISKIKNQELLIEISQKTQSKSFIPDLYVITPTYTRQTQMPDIVNIVQAMMVSNLNIVMLIVEDTSNELRKLSLGQRIQVQNGEYGGLNSAFIKKYLKEPTPTISELIKRYNYPNSNIKMIDMKQPSFSNPLLRGMDQRNLALKWIRKHHQNNTAGIYFGDDDNTFSFKLFQEMSRIKFYNENATVGFLPIGFIRTDMWDRDKNMKKNTWNKGLMMQCNGSRVLRFRTGFDPTRKFATDMAGFGFTVGQLLERPDAWFKNRTRKGHLETDFLEVLLGVEKDDPYRKMLRKKIRISNVSGFGHVRQNIKDKIVGLAGNCTEKLVWHTKRLMSAWVNETDNFVQQVRT